MDPAHPTLIKLPAEFAVDAAAYSGFMTVDEARAANGLPPLEAAEARTTRNVSGIPGLAGITRHLRDPAPKESYTLQPKRYPWLRWAVLLAGNALIYLATKGHHSPWLQYGPGIAWGIVWALATLAMDCAGRSGRRNADQNVYMAAARPVDRVSGK